MGLRKTICGAPTTSQMACGNLSAQTFHPFGYIGKHFVRPFHPIGNAGNPSFQIFHPIGYIGKRRAKTSHLFEYAGNPSAQPFLPSEYIAIYPTNYSIRLNVLATPPPDHPIRFGVPTMDKNLPHRGYTFDSPRLPTIGGYPG